MSMHPHGRPLTRQLDLNLLELFEVIFRTRNLTAAGLELGLSQPAISYGLSKLRDAYGDPLFLRKSRGVQPTAFAEEIAETVAMVLSSIRQTVERAEFEPSQARRNFRIAMTDIGERYFLPALGQHLARHAPGLSIESLSPERAELSEGLNTGSIDMAIGFVPVLGKLISEQSLFQERYVYMMRSAHPAGKKTLRLEDLRTYPQVVAGPQGTRHLEAVERVLLSKTVQANIVMRVVSFLAVAPILVETDLMAPVPQNLAKLVAPMGGLRFQDPPVAFPEFGINMYWHRRLDKDPGLMWLRAQFQLLFGAADQFGSFNEA
ncbi:MAG: LysR family transcriptional regulator [Pigmentiphaga sp.]